MASLEERLAQMRNPTGGTTAAPAQESSVQDRLARMRGNTGEGTTPSPTLTITTEKDEDKPTFWDKLKSFAGFTGEKAAVGAVEGTEGLVNQAGYMGQLEQRGQDIQNAGFTKALGDIFGIEKLQRIGQQQTDEAKTQATAPIETVVNFGDNYAAKVEERYADAPIGKVGRVVGDVAQGLGGMAPAVASNLVVPGSGLVVMTAGAMGNATQEALNEGADDASAMAYGVAVGAVEAATEKLLGGMGGLFGKGALDDAAKGLINNNVKSGAMRGGLNALVSAFGEGTEEFLAEYGQALANRLTIKTEDRTAKELFSDAGYSALIGSIVGSIANVGDSIRAGKSTTPAKAAKDAADKTIEGLEQTPAARGKIQPSDGVSAQTTTDTANDANADTANQGVPGFEVADADAVQGVKTDGLGAADAGFTVNEGPQVPTQSRSTVENINLDDAQRRLVEPPTHEQISEAESLHRAQLGLYTDSEGNIVDYQNSIDELVEPERTLSGVEYDRLQLLLAEAGRLNDVDNVKRIAAKLQDNATFAARVLQATQKWISEEPPTRLAAMYQAVDRFAKTHKAKKGRSIEIPDFLAEAYLKADTEAARDAIVGDIQQYVAQQTRTTFGEAFTALRYVNMLGNFKTQARNVIGNTAMLATSRVKDTVGAAVEGFANAVSKGKAGRTKSLTVGKDFVKAARADFANVKGEVMRHGKYNRENFKGEFLEGIEDSRKLLPPGFEQYRRLTNLAMEGGDVIFSKSAYARSLAGYLKANGVSAGQLASGNVDAALMEKARAYAIKQAQETTFRDSNQISDWASKAGRGEDTPLAVKVLGEGLMPYRRTPANVMLRSLEYSPLGILNTTAKAVNAKKGNATASDVIDALSKTLTGSALMALGYWLRDNDLLRGTGDEDEQGIDALMNRQDWSLTIPGVGSYTFDWAAPASLTMFTGAALCDLFSDEELTLADWFDAFTSLSEPFVQMSMLSGINDTLDSIKYSDNNLFQLAGQLAAGYVTQGLTNTLLGQIERSAEDTRMSTYTDEDGYLPEWMQRSLGKASAKIPGWDYQQTEYLNEFGETESSGGVAQRILENFFSPGYWEPVKEGETAYDFAEEVRKTLGVDAFPDAYPPDDVFHGDENLPLSQAEKENYQRTRGQATKDYMEELADSRDFATLSKDKKREVISAALSYAQEQAKNEALEGKGITVEESDKAAVMADMTPSQYIDWLVADAKAVVPKNYANTPNWQNFEIACSLPQNLAVAMIIAQGGNTGKRIAAAVDYGVDLDKAVAYYRATTERNAKGDSPNKEEKNQRIAALGLSKQELEAIEAAFDLEF